MTALLQRFLREESGATMIEYAIMVSLIAMAALASVAFFGDRVNNMLVGIGDSMPS